jgi:alpha-L-rhamnosidase
MKPVDSITVGVVLLSTVGVFAEMLPVNLRCEYLKDPLGMDVRKPRLSWQLESSQRAQKQKAYQVLVATDPAKLKSQAPDLWDSKRTESSASLQVEYAGKPLVSGMPVFWQVRVWDQDDKASPYSEVAKWEMGLLEPAQWTAQWISDSRPLPEQEIDLYKPSPVPMFRKEFAVAKPVRRARAYISGLGYYELSLNGKRVGDHLLDPAWTTVSKRVLYSTYDVTAAIKPGANAVGIMLGNGWYNPLPMKGWGWLNLREHLDIGRPRAILQLNIEYEDGTLERVVTDPTWRVGDGPIVKNNIYLGEVYDARKEQPGWDSPSFDDATWRESVAAPGAVGELQAQMLPPIRIVRTLKPVAISQPVPEVFIFDMGQNFAGWVRLRINQAEAGRDIQLRFGELLNPDGTLNPMTSVAGQIKAPGVGGPGAPDLAAQADIYIPKGGGTEYYTPRFTWHGFRYVEITRYPGPPPLDAIEGYALATDVDEVGSFECSNPMFNRIHDITRWTLLSNMFSVQSDCPHRERFGYGGDIIASGEMAMFNLDMSAFYSKTLVDYADAVRPNGGFTETAPFIGIDGFADGLGGGAGPIGWGSMPPVLLSHMHQYYGERRLLEEQYPLVTKWIEFLEQQAKDNVIDRGLGDHETLAPKVIPLTSTAFYYHNVDMVARLARILGRQQDANRLADRAAVLKASFNQHFLTAQTGKYAEATQACQAFALYMGLVPAGEHAAAVQVLLDDIAAHNFHLSTGIFGTKYMLDALSANGHADVAHRIVNQKDFPGWGHMLERGATTLWEHWEYSDNTYSHNHPMFGSVSEWFFKVLAGIEPDPQAAGFDKIVIKPAIVPGLQWVKSKYDSVRGPIVSEWKVEGARLTMHVVIPANATAAIYFPAPEIKSINEGDRQIQQASGLELKLVEKQHASFTAGSGDYRFSMPWPPPGN